MLSGNLWLETGEIKTTHILTSLKKLTVQKNKTEIKTFKILTSNYLEFISMRRDKIAYNIAMCRIFKKCCFNRIKAE